MKSETILADDLAKSLEIANTYPPTWQKSKQQILMTSYISLNQSSFIYFKSINNVGNHEKLILSQKEFQIHHERPLILDGFSSADNFTIGRLT